MKNILICFAFIFFLIDSAVCQSERYRKDKSNKMTKHAKKSNDFLSVQAHKIVHSNQKNKEKNEKDAKKRKERHHEELTELNARKQVLGREKKHSGNFRFY